MLTGHDKRKGPSGGPQMLREHERPSPPELRFARVPQERKGPGGPQTNQELGEVSQPPELRFARVPQEKQSNPNRKIFENRISIIAVPDLAKK